jgi:predicted transcriptional regulator
LVAKTTGVPDQQCTVTLRSTLHRVWDTQQSLDSITIVRHLLAMDSNRDVAEDIAELDRRWAKIAAGEPTIPHEDVVRWLNTWGTPEYKPWPESCRAD